ncbi:ribosomal protein S18 acetylase RimI-like enzyme [Bradyrhizobium sp. GM5.1]|uniref:GNAT family N-acetyltransferase n=1 Tax=Bradyrhizobium sp. 173 TaxID=2782644 RepID=UPI001FFB303E|nr:GNAT family N-acetyltransferase [Bradyrhizobium sp. 173]MCK1568763.1 GNAT family N-acetyltransferase [Bradyrhizobium sp. 173]
MTASLEIVHLRPGHATLLAELFAIIAADQRCSRFHPHPFTQAEAARICNHRGNDRYLALRTEERLLAYGLLRGWDEGFAIPSLGIYVVPELRGSGAARLLMEHLHLTAQLSGAKRIRIKVYPDNILAQRLYLSLGYCFSDLRETDQLVGILDLSHESSGAH